MSEWDAVRPVPGGRKEGGYHSRPAARFFNITPHNTNEQPPMRGIWVGGAGDLVIEGPDGVETTLYNVPDGTLLPISPVLVKTTTTATLLSGMA